MNKALLFIVMSIISMFILQNELFSMVDTNSATIKLARMFGKEIFELNGTKFLQPMVQVLNSTSNSRFFNQAYVPKSVKKPYFRISINTMLGFVPDNMKTYAPMMPNEQLDANVLSRYLDFTNPLKPIIKDTIGLEYYALKTLIYDGIQQNKLNIPATAATILGYKHTVFNIPHSAVDSLIRSNSLFKILPKEFQDSILKSIIGFPEQFTLPDGANMNTIFAGVPQIEVGSLFGTELLLRGIPQIDMGTNIGKFSFWGIGLKHSISQYFEKVPIDIAVQAVYQGSNLKNKIGVTNADLTAKATFWDFNIHVSKRFYNMWDVYSGFAYEILNIHSDYTYLMPVETQYHLGLLRGDTLSDGHVNVMPPEPPEYPGDNQPQKTSIDLSNQDFKFVIGTAVQLGPIVIFADYNYSKFSIFTGGVEVRF